MATKTRGELKDLFLNGLKPNQEDFAALIDAILNFSDDNVTVVSGRIGIGTTDPKGSLHVQTTGGTGQTTLTNEWGVVVIGDISGFNLSLDHNELMARNGTSRTPFYLQREGGDVILFNDASIQGDVIFKDTGEVGIKTTTPSGLLHVNGTDRDFVVTEEGNVGIGTDEPSARLHIKTTSGEDPVDTTSTDAALKIGEGNGRHLAIDNNEIMAKDGSDPTKLHLNREGGDVEFGNGDITYSGTLTNTSDRTLKKDIKPLSTGLKEVLQLDPVSFKWKDKANPNKDKKFGFIAQDVQKVLSDIVYKKDEDKTLSMSTMELIPVLVKSIQEQQTQIESLESRIAKLEQLMKK
ncbi:MAG: tail fiber domain-containing protein [Crocinitomicaceae bacterium]|nr:tail fiber domain-containing protein [Crocinitomicaceae bacterium]